VLASFLLLIRLAGWFGCSGAPGARETAMTVGEMCTRSVATVRPDDIVLEAARRMREWRVAGLVVTDEAHHPIGVLTDRDIVLRAVTRYHDRLATLPVSEVMSRDVVTARAHEPLDVVLRRMRALGVRRLPMVNAEGVLEGLVTLNDVLAVMSEELRHVIGLVGRELQHDDHIHPCTDVGRASVA
jgi:CBS domain-containing protein